MTAAMGAPLSSGAAKAPAVVEPNQATVDQAKTELAAQGWRIGVVSNRMAEGFSFSASAKRGDESLTATQALSQASAIVQLRDMVREKYGSVQLIKSRITLEGTPKWTPKLPTAK
jgi:hypothetical protein